MFVSYPQFFLVFLRQLSRSSQCRLGSTPSCSLHFIFRLSSSSDLDWATQSTWHSSCLRISFRLHSGSLFYCSVFQTLRFLGFHGCLLFNSSFSGRLFPAISRNKYMCVFSHLVPFTISSGVGGAGRLGIRFPEPLASCALIRVGQ